MCFQSNLLRGKRGGLSLTSVRVTVTDVVPDNPPFCPTMSFAWITKRYWSLASLSIFGRAVLITPAERQGVKDHTSKNMLLWRFSLPLKGNRGSVIAAKVEGIYSNTNIAGFDQELHRHTVILF